MDAIVTNGLSKRYGEVLALDGLELTIRPGELFGLLGVNGAGKTTAIKLLTGLIKPSAGDALVFGNSIVQQPAAAKSRVAVCPQTTALAENLTVRENLALMAGAYGLSKAQAAAGIETWAQRLGLKPYMDKKAGRLSGGWQRAVSIAMALVPAPQVLFLDEPTLGLDVLARDTLWQIIRALKGQMTVVLTTHYMPEAAALADRVGVLCAGRLLCVGTPEEVCAAAGATDLEAAFVRLVKGVQA